MAYFKVAPKHEVGYQNRPSYMAMALRDIVRINIMTLSNTRGVSRVSVLGEFRIDGRRLLRMTRLVYSIFLIFITGIIKCKFFVVSLPKSLDKHW